MLPDEMERRREIEARLRAKARTWGYREVATPAFEELELFTIRSGEGIIDEMYVFQDKGGRSLALRPELTAPVLRMFVSEGRSQIKPIKWCYYADCFRYERPQKGRYRQFWQFGVELIGADTAMADAEIIMVAADLLGIAGVTFTLKIGHLSFMRTLLQHLPETDQKRIRTFLDKRDLDAASAFLTETGRSDLIGPLRNLINARTLEQVFAVIGEIPEAKRIRETFEILSHEEVEFEINPAIARGLDYYTGIVFECFAEGLGAENQILGGGAYRLAHLFGGEDTPSIGFAIGFDRVMVALGEKIWMPYQPRISVIFTPHARKRALNIARQLREAGIACGIDLTGRGFSAQLKSAGRTADYAIIIGEEEVLSGQVTLKNLQGGDQQTIPLSRAINDILSGSEITRVRTDGTETGKKD
jgi:histidyl-tRNA synthetase